MNIVDDFELKIGLQPNILPGDPEEFKKYLVMDVTQIEKLDSKDCANISYRLGQFSLYIQRSLNKEKAISRILTHKINKMISRNINQYSGAWNMQRAAAIADNDAAATLSDQLVESEIKQDSLEYVSSGLKELANQMKNIQFSKRESNV